MSWTEVDPSLDRSPVRADSSDFVDAAHHFRNVMANASSVIDRFDALTGGDTSHFQGAAAKAFVATLEGLAHDMRDIPNVARSVADVFADHARQLIALQSEVDRALAAALTSRRQRDMDRTAVQQSSTTLRSIQTQLATLRSTSTDPADPQLMTLQSRELAETQRQTSQQATLNSSQRSVEQAVQQFWDFRERETGLNRITAGRLRDIDLRSMSDPSNLEKFTSFVGGGIESLAEFVEELTADNVRMWGAVLRRDWEDLLRQFDEFVWQLNDFLDKIGTTLFWVAVALAGAALIALTLGAATPIVVALGTAAAWAFKGSNLADKAKLATSAYLAARGTPHPRTREQLTWGAVAMDGALLGLSSLVGKVGKPLKNVRFSRPRLDRLLPRMVHFRDTGRFVPKAIERAYRRYFAYEVAEKAIDGANKFFGPKPTPGFPTEASLRLMRPPYSCAGPTQALIGAAR